MLTFTALPVGCADVSRGADHPLDVGLTTGLTHAALQTLQAAHRRVSRRVVALAGLGGGGVAWQRFSAGSVQDDNLVDRRS